jgi:UDP-N-acetylglucosamine:LPS N-acetylglucosamine transferase|nr:PssD/Cps14F family polysaccharide biosynthesis glycosyltransferase [uncultured Acetatifactor sp.]
MEKIKMRKKLCFAASSGGHFEQITMLAPLMKKYESFIVTERTQYEASIDGEQMYYLQQVNRNEALFLFRMTVNTFKSMRLFFKEKPDVVITTGVLAVVPLCLIAKVFKKRLIYIESFAKVSSPTKTGQILYRLADQFYVQWESMLEFYPNAIYLGGIY